jgi:5-methylcytosine-specific restriction protein A
LSEHRINPKAGWANPNGKCRWCQVDGLKGRSTFCSEACVHEWKIRSQPGYVRDCVERRDKGVCAACGLDTMSLKAKSPGNYYLRTPEQRAELERHGIDPHAVHAGEFWQADHVIEVVKGGGQCGLENYQTLCTGCHKAKTKRLAFERAEAKRLAKEQTRHPLFAGVE